MSRSSFDDGGVQPPLLLHLWASRAGPVGADAHAHTTAIGQGLSRCANGITATYACVDVRTCMHGGPQHPDTPTGVVDLAGEPLHPEHPHHPRARREPVVRDRHGLSMREVHPDAAQLCLGRGLTLRAERPTGQQKGQISTGKP
jgi:hypothetical protein